MMRLEGLVFSAQTKKDGMLKVGWQDDVLVPGFAGQLHTQVPRCQRDKGEGRMGTWSSVFGHEMLLGVLIESRNGVAEGTSILYMLPGEGSKGSTKRRDRGVDRANKHGLSVELRWEVLLAPGPSWLYLSRAVSQTPAGVSDAAVVSNSSRDTISSRTSRSGF